MNVGLVGWNGRRNVGDDAMTAVLVHHLAARYQNQVEFTLLADQRALPRLLPSGFGGRLSGYRGYNAILAVPGARIRDALRNLTFDRRFARSVDALLIGGGSIFRSTLAARRYSRLIRSADVGVAGAVGVSVGPFPDQTAEAACQRALEDLEFVTVRDDASSRILKGWNFPKPWVAGTDVALLLPDYLGMDSPPVERGDVLIGVSLRSGAFSEEGEHSIAVGLRRVLESDSRRRLRFFEFCADQRQGDGPVTDRVIASVGIPERTEVEAYPTSPSSFYASIAECDGMVATRLHAAVLSHAMRTPFCILSYHLKNEEFGRVAGLGKDFIRKAEHVNSAWIKKTVEALLEQGFSDSRVEMLESAKEAARRSLGLMTTQLDQRLSRPL